MNRIIEHEPADLIAIAEAGVPLSEFNQALSHNGQWLPLDPPNDGRATVGGVVATGLAGAQQIGYGRPRGSVIGMKVVLADGSVIKAGGRVVKNVAGYDLCKLFTGSYGTLGIITEVNFKLRPRPQRETTVVATGRPLDLIKGACAILDSSLFPVAAELVSSTFASRLGITTDRNSAVLLVRFAGNDKGVEYQTQSTLSELSRNVAVRETDTVSEDTALWQSLAAVPVEVQQGWRVSVLPSRVASLVGAVNEIFGDSFDSQLWQVSVGVGNMRMLDDSNRSAEESSKLINSVRDATRSAGGVLSIAGTSNESSADSIHGRLTNRIKQQLDPRAMFSARVT